MNYDQIHTTNRLRIATAASIFRTMTIVAMYVMQYTMYSSDIQKQNTDLDPWFS